MPRLRRSDNVGESEAPALSVSPAGLTFGGRPLRQAQGRLYGPQGPDRFLENISRTGLQNRRSLGFARDDKEKVVASM